MNKIQVDADNFWIYEQEYGKPKTHDPNQIYRHGLPKFLALLKHYQLKATFMIVGKDLRLKSAREFVLAAVRQGHEIGNHTWSHPIEFATLDASQKRQEILKAHNAITKLTGRSPTIFRGPGYYTDQEIITILQSLNYDADASRLPGVATLLMKLFAMIRGSENKHKTFGRLSDVFCPLVAHRFDGILQTPISVLPILRFPIHSTFAFMGGSVYQALILRYLKAKPKYLLYLFHARDFETEENFVFINKVLATI